MSGAALALVYVTFYNPRYGLLNQVLGAVGLDGTRDWLFDVDTALPAVAATWVFTAGIVIILVMAEIAAIPEEVYDAAQVDGASRWADDPPHHAAAAAQRDRRLRDPRAPVHARLLRRRVHHDRRRPGEPHADAEPLRVPGVLQQQLGLRQRDRRAARRVRAGRDRRRCGGLFRIGERDF